MPADTTADAALKEIEILRSMDTARRAAMTFELSNNLRAVVEAGIRHRNPNWDDQTVKSETMRLMLGNRLFREVMKDKYGAR
jgi:hypothetical protein